MYLIPENESISEFNRFVEWANENKDTWDRVVCSLYDDNSLEAETFIDIIKQLKDNQFYQIIFMMLIPISNRKLA